MKIFRTSFLTLTALLLGACSWESRDERFLREANKFTENQCPKEMDDYTIMDSVVFTPSTQTYAYYYTVKDVLDNDTLYTAELYDLFHDKVLGEIKSSITMKTMKEAGLNFLYAYRSKTSGKVLMQLEFSEKDYAN